MNAVNASFFLLIPKGRVLPPPLLRYAPLLTHWQQ